MPGGREIRHTECAANGPFRRDLQTDFKMHFTRGQAGTAWAFRPSRTNRGGCPAAVRFGFIGDARAQRLASTK